MGRKESYQTNKQKFFLITCIRNFKQISDEWSRGLLGLLFCLWKYLICSTAVISLSIVDNCFQEYTGGKPRNYHEIVLT